MRGKKQEDPFDLKKWTEPAGRHDAPSPQSSIRRSRTRSFGSQSGGTAGYQELIQAQCSPPFCTRGGNSKNGVLYYEWF
ncbi:hypothetical protein VZT92_015421 [Zoarces viviparus]|uniref:Uncharacterized protein n=1 Tax=Zoarces viviparus TaxID=48416 RepID=A0AAW1EWE9_ZOAVI